MNPDAEKLWRSPKGGKLAAVMMGLRPMGDEEQETLDAILAAQKAALAQDAEHWITVHPNGKDAEGQPDASTEPAAQAAPQAPAQDDPDAPPEDI